jgi:hypothetical protein
MIEVAHKLEKYQMDHLEVAGLHLVVVAMHQVVVVVVVA